MDFKNIWFKFCSYVLKSKRESESISDKEWLFRDSLVEYFNLELGWDKQCIETEYVVPSGSSDKRCDIMIFDHDKEAFLIECKRPNNKQSIRNRKQLDSYIATTRIGVGIYFGEFIEVFYDERTDNNLALPIFRIEYEKENNPNGEKFIELFHKDTFNKDALISFCKERYQPIVYLNTELANSESYIKGLIEKDLSNRFENNNNLLFKGILSKYSISVSDKFNTQFYKTAKNEENDVEITNGVNDMPKVNINATERPANFSSEEKNKRLQQEIKQALSLIDNLYGKDKTIQIIAPFSNEYSEKIKLFKVNTGILQKDMALYAFYKYVNFNGNDNIQNIHLRYNLLVKGHKENGINIGIPKTLWEKAMGLFGIKVTKKQIVSEAICYFLDNEYSI